MFNNDFNKEMYCYCIDYISKIMIFSLIFSSINYLVSWNISSLHHNIYVFVLHHTIFSLHFAGESDANMAGIISSDPERGRDIRDSRETI